MLGKVRSLITHSSFRITTNKMLRSETSNSKKVKTSRIRMRMMTMRRTMTKTVVQVERRNPPQDRA